MKLHLEIWLNQWEPKLQTDWDSLERDTLTGMILKVNSHRKYFLSTLLCIQDADYSLSSEDSVKNENVYLLYYVLIEDNV